MSRWGRLGSALGQGFGGGTQQGFQSRFDLETLKKKLEMLNQPVIGKDGTQVMIPTSDPQNPRPQTYMDLYSATNPMSINPMQALMAKSPMMQAALGYGDQSNAAVTTGAAPAMGATSFGLFQSIDGKTNFEPENLDEAFDFMNGVKSGKYKRIK